MKNKKKQHTHSYIHRHTQTAFRLQVDKDIKIKMITGKTTGLKSLLQHTHTPTPYKHISMGIYPDCYSDRERAEKWPVMGFWLLLLLFLVREGMSGGGGG